MELLFWKVLNWEEILKQCMSCAWNEKREAELISKVIEAVRESNLQYLYR